ncbi:MAG TPA: DUF4831 family protein [Bacteroidales bacterium]|nr:DUF4831 family protein [Bacteroidales bacterium]
MTNQLSIRKAAGAGLVILILMFSGCLSLRNRPGSDVVILPLGGEVKVTEGSVIYALPLTVFEIDVVAERTIVVPGPYAGFAKEMLGLDNVIMSEEEIWTMGNVTLCTVEELDPSQFYIIQGTSLMQTNVLALKRSGLILDITPDVYSSTSFSHNQGGTDYSGLLFPDLGADVYTSMKTDTVYKVIKADTAFIRVPYLVENKKKPSVGEEAAAAAQKLLELREGKHMILTGETNIFPQDEAAINEINRLDREYTALFAGKNWSETRHFRIWFTPQPSMAGKKTTLFNFSSVEGMRLAGSSSGKPVDLELVPSNKTQNLNLVVRPIMSQKEIDRADRLYYRVPDVVDIRITQGNETLCTARKLVYQFGNTVTLPSNIIIGK